MASKLLTPAQIMIKMREAGCVMDDEGLPSEIHQLIKLNVGFAYPSYQMLHAPERRYLLQLDDRHINVKEETFVEKLQSLHPAIHVIRRWLQLVDFETGAEQCWVEISIDGYPIIPLVRSV